MEAFEIIAEKRDEQGKGASRRLRRDGKVPVILYGAGKAPVMLQVVHKDFAKQLENEAFYAHILTVSYDGGSERVVLKDLQRHPFKQRITHVDLLRVAENEALTMSSPVHFVNEESCVGRKAGGIVSHLLTEIEIVCLPRDLPEYIEVDIGELDVGETLHLGDLKMPEGVKIAALEHGGDPAQPVVSIVKPRAERAEATEEGEAAEGGEAPEAEAD